VDRLLGRCNGITGSSVRCRHARHTHSRPSNFSSAALTAEPLVTAARAGRRVAVLSATQLYPFEPHLAALAAAGVPADRFLAFSGFEHEIAPGQLHGADELRPAGKGWRDLPRHRGVRLELELTCGDTGLVALVFDDPADPTAGFDTVLVRRSRGDATGQALLKPHAAASVALGRVRRSIRRGDHDGATLLAVRPPSCLALYRRAAHAVAGTGPADRRLPCAIRRSAARSLCQRGGLGPTLISGGDGGTERR
jgi:hypothetical protein